VSLSLTVSQELEALDRLARQKLAREHAEIDKCDRRETRR
jgi:hypothetical protein